MTARHFLGLPAGITFTSDFHELVRGDLRPATTATLRYDPARIVPKSENYIFGDPAHHIVAHVQFPPSDDITSVPLSSFSGILTAPDEDPTGAGSMLTGEIAIPPDATAMVVWFTYVGPSGRGNSDSDYGRNFRFGFPSQQIRLLEASVHTSDDVGTFSVRVSAEPQVHRVSLRMRVVNDNDDSSADIELRSTGERDNGWPVWQLPESEEVKAQGVVQFKLYYWIGDFRYKDDDSGLYYLAHGGEPERVPPPPAALGEAAKAWK